MPTEFLQNNPYIFPGLPKDALNKRAFYTNEIEEKSESAFRAITQVLKPVKLNLQI